MTFVMKYGIVANTDKMPNHQKREYKTYSLLLVNKLVVQSKARCAIHFYGSDGRTNDHMNLCNSLRVILLKTGYISFQPNSLSVISELCWDSVRKNDICEPFLQVSICSKNIFLSKFKVLVYLSNSNSLLMVSVQGQAQSSHIKFPHPFTLYALINIRLNSKGAYIF